MVSESTLARDVATLRQGLVGLPEPVSRPILVMVSGLPGTGKSYFCRALAQRLPSVIVETDVLRKLLFSSPCHTQAENRRLFNACHRLVEELLQKGIRVILDATNLSEGHREQLYHIAEKMEAKLIIVRVEATPEAVRQRLEERRQKANGGDHSDADWSVYQRMKGSVEAISRPHFAVDTTRDIGPVLDKVVREARR